MKIAFITVVSEYTVVFVGAEIGSSYSILILIGTVRRLQGGVCESGKDALGDSTEHSGHTYSHLPESDCKKILIKPIPDYSC